MEAAEQTETALPPAGDDRREELRRRLDTLTAEAERIASELEVERIDPAKLRIDSAVASHFAQTMDAEIFVSEAQSDHRYAWVYRDPYNKFGGRFVRAMQAQGWEIVTHDMPESRENKAPTGERWIADCLLMRCRLDRHFLNEQRNRQMRRARELGVAADLIAEADRRGVNVHVGELPDSISRSIQSASQENMSTRAQKRAFAKQMAGRKLADAVRTGTIPGMPIRG